jgi:uncharacterized protein (TIGR02145 family)
MGNSSAPFSNAVYSCQNGRCYCDSCDGSGYKNGERCKRRCEKGWINCPTCKGEGDVPCDLKYGSSYGIGKLFDLAAGKVFCKGKGTITCSRCFGKGEIVCKTCYGDYVENRYGKVDCSTCQTAGELASITYIDTEILKAGQFRVVTDGKKITAPNFGVDTIKKFVDTNGQLIQTYKNHNGDTKENYDEYSSFCSKISLKEIGYYKDRYPKLIDEEMYYEGVPCSTFNYNHILSTSFHEVSVLNIDKTKEVLFHSDPADSIKENESFKNKINEWLHQAFSTKLYIDKVDRKHEIYLMIHMAKADGVVDEQEKLYLSKIMTSLHGFTQKEKEEIIGLMSVSILPPIHPTNAYFSSKERTEDARKKLVELVSKADGEYSPGVKSKLEEINKAIELGYKIKPSTIGRFLKTWQISVSLFVFLCLIGYGVLYYQLVNWSGIPSEELGIFTSEPEPVTEPETEPVTNPETEPVTNPETEQVNESEAELESVRDIDNNLYQIVKIGSQYWFKSNLKVSRYNNGDNISSSLSNSAWANTTSGAYAIYNNDPVNDGLYGKLYNHYAVTDSRGLCPTGWHVPSDAEWTTLANHVGESSVAGGALKSTATQPTPGGWASPNAGATNSSGFTASPGGFRYPTGGFGYMTDDGRWWSSSSSFSGSYAWSRNLINDFSGINRNYYSRASGYSVRCCRD